MRSFTYDKWSIQKREASEQVRYWMNVLEFFNVVKKGKLVGRNTEERLSESGPNGLVLGYDVKDIKQQSHSTGKRKRIKKI